MGFFSWYVDPLKKIIEELRNPPAPPEVTLPKAPPPVIFRPATFAEYIGQSRAKERLQAFIDGVKSRQKPFPHTLIYGNAGCGKTTLARILANELHVPFRELITSDIKTVYDIKWQLKDFDGAGGILFLDEIHAIDRGLGESLYPLMEEFKLNGNYIAPFTLVGATTELGELLRDRRPLVDRFKIPIELEPYAAEDIKLIIQQYMSNVFSEDDTLPDDALDALASNARGTPRMGIRLLETAIYLEGDTRRALDNYDILQDGYTRKDLKCLAYVALNENGVGLQGLCSYLGIPAESYVYDVEPYLLQNQLIIRTPRGRRITNEGRIKIEELSKCC